MPKMNGVNTGNGVILSHKPNGDYLNHTIDQNANITKRKPICLRNYVNRDKDIFDTLHWKDDSAVSTI